METIKQHLRSRYMNADLYKTYIDEEDRCAAWLLFNLSGQVVGYHQYRPDCDKEPKNNPKDARYYTFVGGHKKDRRLSLWGLETVRFDPRILFFTEGVFDAAPLHTFGLPAVATMSNDPKHLKQQVRLLGEDRLTVAICDDDAAGRKLAKLCDDSLNVGGGRDPGDLNHQEMYEFVSYLKERYKL